jgi:hypothetical protein
MLQCAEWPNGPMRLRVRRDPDRMPATVRNEDDPMTQTIAKRAYQAPALRTHGSIEQITQQNSRGSFIDATFAAGTPVNQLTLS